MSPDIFRACDIRGHAENDLTDDLVFALGQAFASLIRARRHGARIAVGRDCRLSGRRIFDALTAGLQEAGADVLDIGVVPSPVLYFAAHFLEPDGAVIITGSHNPGDDNGFKLMCGTDALHGDDIQELRRRVEERDFDDGHGTCTALDVTGDYESAASAAIELGKRRFGVVIDAGHGAGGPVALSLYRRLGFDPTPLYCEMDGRFPAHHPDPTVEANLEDLKAKVMETGAELGLAFDGDADRLGAVDGHGRVLWGDQLMLLFGRAILEDHPGATFIGEVKCSQTLYDGLRSAGGNPIMWKVGHSPIKAKMRETGALLAGEMSGHMYFADRYYGFDDGIYAGARLLELLSRQQPTLAELRDQLPATVTTPELRIPCPDRLKFEVVERVRETLRDHPEVLEVIDIDGVRALFAHGWGLVRASNTGALLAVRVEAEDQSYLAAIRAILESAIANAKEKP
ncbi:MAG: phosphomannomutase/phosphoglucomutase [Deltaproteobacteria bacterium]|nr:phosphomannomutase/phosphoglucomutase [Deltaproteobacteria bacterium]